MPRQSWEIGLEVLESLWACPNDHWTFFGKCPESMEGSEKSFKVI
jgi:hypothetical protein